MWHSLLEVPMKHMHDKIHYREFDMQGQHRWFQGDNLGIIRDSLHHLLPILNQRTLTAVYSALFTESSVGCCPTAEVSLRKFCHIQHLGFLAWSLTIMQINILLPWSLWKQLLMNPREIKYYLQHSDQYCSKEIVFKAEEKLQSSCTRWPEAPCTPHLWAISQVAVDCLIHLNFNPGSLIPRRRKASCFSSVELRLSKVTILLPWHQNVLQSATVSQPK